MKPVAHAGALVRDALERAVDELVAVARVDPAEVVAAARRLGIPVRGSTPQAQLASLRAVEPSRLDALARTLVTGDVVGAGVQGFVANVGGLLSLPVALPADALGTLAWMVRAASATMGAYGFESETEQGRLQLRIALLLAVGASSVDVEGGRIVLRSLSRQLLTGGASTDAVGAAVVRRLATRLAKRFGVRRLSRAVPLVGGVVGAGLNAGLVAATAAKVRQHYRGLLVEEQTRRARYGITSVDDASDVVLDVDPSGPDA